MPRPPAGDSSDPPLSPSQSPPAPVAPPAPFSYAGHPIPPAPAANGSPTLVGLFNAFKRRWVLGTFVGLLVAGTVSLSVWMVLPGGKHEARGLVNLHERSIADTSFRTNEDYESYRREQIFIFKTRDLLRRTVNDPAVSSLEMIRGVEEPERLLEDNLVITAAAPTILAVTLKGNNLEEMKTIVDALMKRYVDDANDAARRKRDEEIKKLDRLSQNQKNEIEADEQSIKLIARGTGATGSENSEKRLAQHQQRINEYDTDIIQLNKAITRLEATHTVAKQQLEQGFAPIDPDRLQLKVEQHPQVAALELVRKKAQEQLDKNLAVAAKPENDQTVKESREALTKAEAAVEGARKSVGTEIEAILKSDAVANLKQKIAELDTLLAEKTVERDKIKADRDGLQKTLASGAESNFEVTTLLQGLIPKREAHVKTLQQIAELRSQTVLDNRANIRQVAQPLPNNNLTKKLAACGLAGFATFGFVVLLVAFLEWRTRRVDGVDQVVTELGMRILGTVPAFPNPASLKAADAGTANWRFALNEAINSTRTLLLHSARAHSMQVVMVTSATQGEGKTSLASQLASSMATAGMRSLIVDCDLRNPSVHKLFDVALSNGVSEILTQEADVAEVVRPTAIPNLWVIPAGVCANRVIAALAQGQPLETLFNRLRGQFDFVIVDSCPVLPVADALLIGQHVDGVVFSIMQDISQLPKVMLASEKLTHLNIPVLGAVVNGIKQDAYSSGYNYVKQLPA